MSDVSTDWFAEPAPAPDDEVLYVDVAGYEGPLDLLLDLARRQKVHIDRRVGFLGRDETILECRVTNNVFKSRGRGPCRHDHNRGADARANSEFRAS